MDTPQLTKRAMRGHMARTAMKAPGIKIPTEQTPPPPPDSTAATNDTNFKRSECFSSKYMTQEDCMEMRAELFDKMYRDNVGGGAEISAEELQKLPPEVQAEHKRNIATSGITAPIIMRYVERLVSATQVASAQDPVIRSTAEFTFNSYGKTVMNVLSRQTMPERLSDKSKRLLSFKFPIVTELPIKQTNDISELEAPPEVEEFFAKLGLNDELTDEAAK